MPVTLSIKNAPDDVVDRLRARANRHRRSLQGELLSIIEAAVTEKEGLTPKQILAKARALGMSSDTSSVEIIRADRDRDERGYGG
jgi:plasmid stability protein